MSPVAMMMVHNPCANPHPGDTEEMQESHRHVKQVQGIHYECATKSSRGSRHKISQLMIA